MLDYDIKTMYEEMELLLIKSMKRNYKRHLKEEDKTGREFPQWQALKLRELKRYQRQNKDIIGGETKGFSKQISKHIQKEFKEGSYHATKEYRARTGKTVSESSFFKTNDKKVTALIDSVNNNLSEANKAILRMTNDQYRQVIHKSAMFVANGAMTPAQAIDMANKDFLRRGLNVIEYKDGRRVNIASYSQMAVRTASQRAMLMGEGAFRKKHGLHLVRVSEHGTSCPLCHGWQRKILIDDVYSGGSSKDGKYTLLSTAMDQGLFHPNCRHGLTTYFDEISDINASYANGKDGSESDHAYEEDMNYINQKIKEYTRLEVGSLDETNVQTYKAKRKEWQEKKKELIDSIYTPFKTQAAARTYTIKFAENVNIKDIHELSNLNIINETLETLTSKYPIRKLKHIRAKALRNASAEANFETLTFNKDDFNKTSFEYPDYKQQTKQRLEKIIQQEKEIDEWRNESILSNDWSDWYEQRYVVQKNKLNKWKNELEENMKYSTFTLSRAKQFAGSEIKATITHEYGHIIADQYIGQINGWAANPGGSFAQDAERKTLVKKITAAFRKAKKNGDIYNISKYASTNGKEFFAESFVLYELDREKLPTYIIDVIEEVIRYGKNTM